MYNFTATMNIIYSKQEPKYEIISHKKILKKISLVFSSKKKKKKPQSPKTDNKTKQTVLPNINKKTPNHTKYATYKKCPYICFSVY